MKNSSTTRTPGVLKQARRRIFGFGAVGALLAVLSGPAWAATLNVPGTYPDIQSALNVASPSDLVLVAPGTYVVGATITVTVTGVTIQGSGIGSSTLQVASAVGDMMLITASGVTVRDFTIQKTDLPNQHLIAIQAPTVTIRDNEVYGPDPGTPWSVNGIVSRAMVVSGGSNGLNILGNTIHHLRQPAYISGPTTGTITNNVVYGTRGWVIEGAGPLTFSGNSWSTGGNQGADIALLSGVPPLDYPNLLSLSSTNSNAYISGQFPGASSGRAVAYVDDGGAADGVGMVSNPYQTIVNGIANALPGGAVSVAAGSYPGNLTLNKMLSLQGARVGVAACGRVSGAPNPAVESIISGAGVLLTLTTGCAGSTIDGFAFSGGSRSIESTGGPLNNLTIRNNHMGGFTSAGTFLNDSGDDITLHQNNIDAASKVGGGGIVHFDTDSFRGLHVTSNCVVNGPTGTGMFVDGNRNVNATGSRAPLISGNTFRGNGTGANLGSRAFTDGTISNNTFTMNAFDGLQGGIKNTAITGNTFSLNGRSGLALTSFGNLGIDRGAQGSLITLNTFTGNVRDGLFYSATQAPGTVSTNPAHNNNFAGNGAGVRYTGLVEVLNLTCNWWNNAGGPDTAVVNPNPPADDLAARNALFVQWLTAPAPGGLCNGGDDVTPGPAPGCISIANPCITIPVTINRVNATPMRGFSVTFALSPELMLCSGLASITEGAYLNSVPASSTNFQVVDNLDGTYTVDCAILGLPCGKVGDGTLFNVAVKKAGGDGTGTISVTSVLARDCANAPIPGFPGAPLSITIDTASPAAIGNLAAAQVKTGNLPALSTTTDVTLTWSPAVEAGATVAVWRKGFGFYPEYDDAGGAAPAAPATPAAALGAGWTLTTVTTTPGTDRTGDRDFYYYVAFVTDACGNVSVVSNRTNGTLNYHLGDTHNGFANCTGNNLVNLADISYLGGHYGVVGLALNDTLNCLDVGPTTDFSVNARPTTDNKIQFEDLIMFAINHGTVSKPWVRGSDNPARAEGLQLVLPELPAVGGTFEARLEMSAGGSIQGVTVDLGYDRTVVEMVSVSAGDLMSRQGAESLVLSAQPGNVDAAVFGQGATIRGDGDLARVTFRVLAEGNPGIVVSHAEGRDGQNRKVELNTGIVDVGNRPVTRTFLGVNYPNPFMAVTQIPLGLERSQEVNLAVFDVTGRLVRTLVNGSLPAGERVVEWDGRDDSGRIAASGFYVIRLATGATHETRTVKIVR